MATHNTGFASGGVTRFADTLVQAESSVLRMKFSAHNPRHRTPETLDSSSPYPKNLFFS